MEFNFSELRQSYIEIKEFLEYASGMKVKGLDTKVVDDLGLWGDDNFFLLEEFVEKYNLNFDNFDYSKHFESEGELFNSYTALLALINLPFFIIFKVISWVFPKIETPYDNDSTTNKNNKTDLTFGDLIASKLKGEFCLRKDTIIELRV